MKFLQTCSFCRRHVDLPGRWSGTWLRSRKSDLRLIDALGLNYVEKYGLLLAIIPMVIEVLCEEPVLLQIYFVSASLYEIIRIGGRTCCSLLKVLSETDGSLVSLRNFLCDINRSLMRLFDILDRKWIMVKHQQWLSLL